jgi:hypothetical protein
MEVGITEEERNGVARMPKENAPGPDGFIGAFYLRCWDIVKGEVIAAVSTLPTERRHLLKVHLGPPCGFWRIDKQQLHI